MKKILMAAIVLMACLAVSCQKEKDEELPTFIAHADNSEMKTHLEGNLIIWDLREQVKAFGCNSGYAIYSTEPLRDDPTWTRLYPLGNHDISGSPYRFIYPSDMASGDGNNLYITYPQERQFSNGSLKDYPMYGEVTPSSDQWSREHFENVAFRNIGGLIKIVLPEIERNVSFITISANEPLNGTYKLMSNLGLEFTGTATDDNKRIDIICDYQFSPSECIYVSVPAGNYTNFTIDIHGGNYIATKVGSGTINVAASKITTINISNLVFTEWDRPAATLERMVFNALQTPDHTNIPPELSSVTSIVFHYNYYDDLPGAERIDNDPYNLYSTPIYGIFTDNEYHVYTPAPEIYAPVNSSYLFRELVVQSIDFGNGFNTSNVTNMDCMFSGCSSLTSLDLSHFNTSNVTDMLGMFSGCSSLTSLDLSHFNTSNVTDMAAMFSGCTNLQSINLSSFNTSMVGTLASMFYGCENLVTLDLTSFTQSPYYIYYYDFGHVFQNCYRLQRIRFSKTNFTMPWNNYCADFLQYTGRDCASLVIECNTATRDMMRPWIEHESASLLNSNIIFNCD